MAIQIFAVLWYNSASFVRVRDRVALDLERRDLMGLVVDVDGERRLAEREWIFEILSRLPDVLTTPEAHGALRTAINSEKKSRLMFRAAYLATEGKDVESSEVLLWIFTTPHDEDEDFDDPNYEPPPKEPHPIMTASFDEKYVRAIFYEPDLMKRCFAAICGDEEAEEKQRAKILQHLAQQKH